MQRIKRFLAIIQVALIVGGVADAQQVPVADSLSAQTDSAVFRGITPLPQKKGFMGWLRENLAGSRTPSDKKFDYTLVVGPYYSNTASFSIAGGITGKYSWDRSDSLLQLSDVSAMAQVSVKGMVSVNISGRNYMKHDRFRWNYRLKWQRQPIDFWGAGYDKGRADNKENVDRNQILFKPEGLVRFWGPLFVGLTVNLNMTDASKLSDKSRIDNQKSRIFSVGVGPTLQIDTRDNASNAYKGVFFRLDQLFYPNHLNSYAFNSTDITFSTYHQVWKGGMLAGEVHAQFNNGDEIPWTMMAQVAENSCRMRGYYEGRYHDRNIMEFQIELRQRIYKRFGVAFFGGAANVFPYIDDIEWKHTLPNFGGGIRYELKNRTNLRLDLGFTKNKPGVVFNINEAF